MITVDWHLDFINNEAFAAHQVSRMSLDNDDITCYLLGRYVYRMTAQVPNMRSFYRDPTGQCNMLTQVVSFSASILVHHGIFFVVEMYGPST